MVSFSFAVRIFSPVPSILTAWRIDHVNLVSEFGRSLCANRICELENAGFFC